MSEAGVPTTDRQPAPPPRPRSSPAPAPAPAELPVLIVGAGVSGLLLAQALRRRGVAVRVFERDTDFATRGIGWGLTLHWSLPALKTLLPPELAARLPEAYVDRAAVAAGAASRFPFYDLSTARLVLAVPPASEAERVRVSRGRLRTLLATGIDVEWGRTFTSFVSGTDSVSVSFEDGSSVTGSLLVGCDGTYSRVRRALFPDRYETYRIPLRVMGLKVDYPAELIDPLRQLDPFFLQGTSSENETYAYFSMLDAKQRDDGTTTYSCQMVFSWPLRADFFGHAEPIPFPETNQGRLDLVKGFARTWADPFRSLVLGIPDDTDVKTVDLSDYLAPADLRSSGRAVLMGDAMHAMAMYRGEGANHAIVDVLDFTEGVVPHLAGNAGEEASRQLRAALDSYETGTIERARPAVLASRQACLDAHSWKSIGAKSPLLSRRAMRLVYDGAA